MTPIDRKIHKKCAILSKWKSCTQARSQDLEKRGAFLKEWEKCKRPWPEFSLVLNQYHTVCPKIETRKQVISKKKKKKVFAEIESGFSAKIRNSNGFLNRITTSTSQLQHIEIYVHALQNGSHLKNNFSPFPFSLSLYFLPHFRRFFFIATVSNCFLQGLLAFLPASKSRFLTVDESTLTLAVAKFLWRSSLVFLRSLKVFCSIILSSQVVVYAFFHTDPTF